MDMSNYKYWPLTEHDSFRLIHLHPSPLPSSPLHCTLLHTTLSACDLDIISPFTALSYVWGDPTKTAPLIIDDCPVTITSSLYSALLDLRDATRTLRLWADALCIDQSNAPERSSQVSMMGDIYSTAQHTVIHLSASNAGYTAILRSLRSNTSGTIQTTSRLVALAEETMLQNPWFIRVWVFQELVLSRDPWVQSGPLRARWVDLCTALLSTPSPSRSPRLQILSDMNAARGPHNQSLLRHLSSRRGLGATNPVDMIYSHLGVISDLAALKTHVEVDYEQSCARVYEDVGRYILEGIGPGGPDGFFRYASENYLSKLDGLASWAPDWSLKGSGLAEMYNDNITSTLRSKSEDYFTFVGSPLVLGYIGYQVDAVKDVSLVFPAPEDVDESRERYWDVVDELVKLYSAAGVWWSGDEFGRYRHWNVCGKEEHHARLCRDLKIEWLHLLSTEFVTRGEKERQPNGTVVTALGEWFDARIEEGKIMAGNDSEGLLNLMFLYLYSDPQNTVSKVLKGRRLCSTSSGKIGVVPAQAKCGDRIVYFAGMEIALVLRGSSEGLSVKTEEDIRRSLNDKGSKGRVEVVGCEEEMGVYGCSLVGEGYLDGEVGWRKADKDVERTYTIYALR